MIERYRIVNLIKRAARRECREGLNYPMSPGDHRMRPNPYEYVCRVYDVPAEYGRVIVWNGRTGVIVEDRGNYIGVCFDDGPVNRILSFHPREDGLKYLGMRESKNIRKLTRSQKRYREYLANRDCFQNFRDYLEYLKRKAQGERERFWYGF